MAPFRGRGDLALRLMAAGEAAGREHCRGPPVAPGAQHPTQDRPRLHDHRLRRDALVQRGHGRADPAQGGRLPGLDLRPAGIRYTGLRYYNAPSKGGHFAAAEQPRLSVPEVRAGIRAIARAERSRTGVADASATRYPEPTPGGEVVPHCASPMPPSNATVVNGSGNRGEVPDRSWERLECPVEHARVAATRPYLGRR